MLCLLVRCENGIQILNLTTYLIYVAVCSLVQEPHFFGSLCPAILLAYYSANFIMTRLGKPGRRSPGLWAEEHASRPPPSPLRPWELSDAFHEGISLLQLYPVEAAGGIDMILQTASDMAQRREDEKKAPKVGNLGLGARLRVTMWKGFTNQLSPALSDEEVEEEESEGSPDDGNETEQEGSSLGITSRLANTVWRGITNQSSMEVPPSPLTPLTSRPSPSPSPSQSTFPSTHIDSTSPFPPTSSGPNIWGYAEKLKDSDAAASFAKVSSNWRAKAMDAWSARKKKADQMEAMSPTSTTSELPPRTVSWSSWKESSIEAQDRRRESLPTMDRSNVYSPPPRPAFFRPPRDSFMPPARTSASTSSPIDPDVLQRSGGLVHRTKASVASMAGLSDAPPPKQGPKPLRLNSAHLMTAPKPAQPSRSSTNTPTRYHSQWSEVMRSKGHAAHKESYSSVSSLSPSDALSRSIWKGNRSDAENDSTRTSRLVPINRRSISPMAPGYRTPPSRPLSTGSSSDRVMQASPQSALSEGHSERGWGRVDLPDSLPPSPSPSPIPHTPITDGSLENSDVRVNSGEHQRLGSVILSDPNDSPSEIPPPRKLARKKTPLSRPMIRADEASNSSVPPMPTLPNKLRSKRHPQRPLNLRTKSRSDSMQGKIPSPSTLSPDGLAEPELAAPTPRASTFDVSESSSGSPTSPKLLREPRKVSADEEGRTRKPSTDRPRIRKVSTESRDARGKRESSANEGDDEGYGGFDFLSAYESES